MSAEPEHPGNTPRPEPEGNSYRPLSEPVPEWDHAREVWQWSWQFHWAGLGALFSLLALHALWHVVVTAGKRWKPRRLLALVVNCLLVTFGWTRALFLFINPYESDECHVLPTCPVLLTRILFGLGLPCLTASFSLIHLAFLQVTKLKLYPAKLQSGKFIFSVIAFHFTLALVTEVILSLFADGKVLGIVCQSFFIIVSFILSTSFLYSGTKILAYVERSNSRTQRLGSISAGSKRSLNDSSSAPRPYRPNVSKLVRITYITVFLGFSSCALQLYSIFYVHNMYSGDYKTPKPWPWYIFQSLYRLVELTAGCTMAYVSQRSVTSATIILSCFRRKDLNKLSVYCTSTRTSTGSQTTTQRNELTKAPVRNETSTPATAAAIDATEVNAFTPGLDTRL